MWRFLVLTVVVVMTGAALADDARQLRLEAGALIQAAEVAATAHERRALLEEAHGKLLEIRERWPSVSVRVTLYLGGRRVSLSPEDVSAMVAAAPSADLDIGNLREVLGRMPSPVAVDENGWTDLHWAAALNLPDLAEALLDGGADVAAPLKADGELLSDRLQQSLRDLEAFSDRVLSVFRRNGAMPLHVAAVNDAREAATLLIARGADIHAKSNHGATPLHSAAYGNASGSGSGVDCPRCRYSRQEQSRCDTAALGSVWQCLGSGSGVDCPWCRYSRQEQSRHDTAARVGVW